MNTLIKSHKWGLNKTYIYFDNFKKGKLFGTSSPQHQTKILIFLGKFYFQKISIFFQVGKFYPCPVFRLRDVDLAQNTLPTFNLFLLNISYCDPQTNWSGRFQAGNSLPCPIFRLPCCCSGTKESPAFDLFIISWLLWCVITLIWSFWSRQIAT